MDALRGLWSLPHFYDLSDFALRLQFVQLHHGRPDWLVAPQETSGRPRRPTVRGHFVRPNTSIYLPQTTILQIPGGRFLPLNVFGIGAAVPAPRQPRFCHSPFVQQLQFQASGRHHPPEATVAAVDRQREALIIFWWKGRGS